MAVPAGPTEQRYVGNAVSTVFTVPFLVIKASDLAVYVDGIKLASGYTQAGTGNSASTVTFGVAPALNAQILFTLEVPFERLNDYQENGDFLAKTINNDYDRIWQALKQLLRYSDRSLRLGPADLDGSGWYRAKGNGIRDLRDPVLAQDAATMSWTSAFVAMLVSQIQGPINNAGNIFYMPPSGLAGVVQDMSNTTDMLKGVSYIGGASRVVATVLEVMALPVKGSTNVFALGYYAAGDGGGGNYTYVAGSTAVVNGGTVLSAAGGVGRWILCQAVPPSLRQFGCKGDGTSDDTAGYLAAVATGMSFHVPRGDFKVAPVGPNASYPGPIGYLRTSAAILSSGQTVTGEGDDSILRWGSATLQGFFLVKQAAGVRVQGIRFIGGHSSVIVDPVADGAVDSVWIENCAHEGQAMGICGGRQIALDPTGSKSHSNFHVIGCRFKNMSEHSVMVTNCYRGQVHGNDFRDSTGGYCIDLSQGCRGVTAHNNTADNVLHFNKIESTNPTGGNQSLSSSTSCSVTNNVVTRCSGYGVLVNSLTERVFIHGNTLQGSTTQGILIEAATGFSHDGQIIIANNIVRTALGGVALRAANIGQALLPPIVIGNHLYGSTSAIDWRLRHGRITNNELFSSDGNVMNIGASGSPNLIGLVITDNQLRGISGIVSQNDVPLWTRVQIEGNEIWVSNFAIFAPTQAGIEVSRICRNVVHYADATSNDAIQLNKVSASQLCDNNINMPTASTGRAIATFGSALKCRISGNVSTRPFNITSPDATTSSNTNNNITDAAYAA